MAHMKALNALSSLPDHKIWLRILRYDLVNLELQVYDVNFGNTKYEHSVLRKYFLKTAVSDRGSISLVFWCLYFESRFPTVDFKKSEMPIDLLGVGTDPLPGRFQLQLPTPNKSIGPSEIARDEGRFQSRLLSFVFRW